MGGGARPAGCNADRIHSVLLASLWFGKESQGSRLTLLTSVHHCYHTKWHSFTSPGGSIRLRRTSASQYPVLKVRAVRDARCRAARRYIATAGGPRGRGSAPPRFLHNRVGCLPPRAPNEAIIYISNPRTCLHKLGILCPHSGSVGGRYAILPPYARKSYAPHCPL